MSQQITDCQTFFVFFFHEILVPLLVKGIAFPLLLEMSGWLLNSQWQISEATAEHKLMLGFPILKQNSQVSFFSILFHYKLEREE